MKRAEPGSPESKEPIEIIQLQLDDPVPKDTEVIPICVYDEVKGAIPNRSMIEKQNSESGDTHQNGARGKVVGSMGPALFKEEMLFGYFVCWDSHPDKPCFVVGNRIKVVQAVNSSDN